MKDDLFTWKTASNDIAELEKGIILAQSSNAKTLIVLTCNNNHYPEEPLNRLLKSCSIPLLGGIYPMLTHQDMLIKQGAIIIGFPDIFETTLFPEIHLLNDEDDLEELINTKLEDQLNFSNQESFLIFYDGLMTNIEDFIDCLFGCLDHTITIAGGGAGHLDFMQRPCIFTNQGLHSNAVLLTSLPKKLTTSVAHGWKIFDGPFLVSEAEGQTVKSLNYRPAFEVYSQAIEKVGKYKFHQNHFFEIAKHFPLGIEDISNNLIVRDPILSENNYLQCVGRVPINSMVYLLEGDINNLISAAEDAAEDAFAKHQSSTMQAAMIFDCISRVLFMEDEFDKELTAINNHCLSPSLFGVLSIGEIANSKSGAINLLNKSTVISVW